MQTDITEHKKNKIIALLKKRDNVDNIALENSADSIFNENEAESISKESVEEIFTHLSSREHGNFMDAYFCSMLEENYPRREELLELAIKHKDKNATFYLVRDIAAKPEKLNSLAEELKDCLLHGHENSEELTPLLKYSTVNDDQAFLLNATFQNWFSAAEKQFTPFYELLITAPRYANNKFKYLSFTEERNLRFLRNKKHPNNSLQIDKNFVWANHGMIFLYTIPSPWVDILELPDFPELLETDHFMKHDNGLIIPSQDVIVNTWSMKYVDAEIIIAENEEAYLKQIEFASHHSYAVTVTTIENTAAADTIAILDLFDDPESPVTNTKFLSIKNNTALETQIFVGVPASSITTLTLILKNFS